ncbi:MAG UNVERIFIED_CONTAM: hypothetical protein LVR29_22825 [Microcystis novacekii LVE1205-3]|jgi:hypothetical protein
MSMARNSNSIVFSPKTEINYQSNGSSSTSEADAKIMAARFREEQEAQFNHPIEAKRQGGQII